MTDDQESALDNWRIYCADLEQIGASLIEHDEPQSPSKTLLNTFAARIALDSPTTTCDNLPDRSVAVRRHLADAIMRACAEMGPRPDNAPERPRSDPPTPHAPTDAPVCSAEGTADHAPLDAVRLYLSGAITVGKLLELVPSPRDLAGSFANVHDDTLAHYGSEHEVLWDRIAALSEQLATCRIALETVRPLCKHASVDGSDDADAALALIQRALDQPAR